MARPKKETVDYFPHDCDCSSRKTLYILEQKYGNDGYSFWWKLLELLGSTDGHFIDCNNPVTWEFLQAKTRLCKDKCTEILNLLSSLGAINKELWEEKMVWCDNFVHRVADVYRNRRVEIPSPPSIYTAKPEQRGVSTGENPQSKVKESKVNNTNRNGRFVPPSLGEVEDYVVKNKLRVSPKDFYKFFTAGEPSQHWIDSNGNKVKNWKQKLLTWNRRAGKKPKDHSSGGSGRLVI